MRIGLQQSRGHGTRPNCLFYEVALIPTSTEAAIRPGFYRLQLGKIRSVNLGLGPRSLPVSSRLVFCNEAEKLQIGTAGRAIWLFYLTVTVALMLITPVPALLPTLSDLADASRLP